MGCHFLFQWIFPTQGSNPCLLCLLRCLVDSLPLVLPGKPSCGTHAEKELPEVRSSLQNEHSEKNLNCGHCDRIFLSDNLMHKQSLWLFSGLTKTFFKCSDCSFLLWSMLRASSLRKSQCPDFSYHGLIHMVPN